jgi:hypothetical protein
VKTSLQPTVFYVLIYALQFLHTFETMLQVYYEPFYKIPAVAQICKVTHCITNSFLNYSTPVSGSQFRAGSSIRESGGTVHAAAQIVQHPLYDYWTLDFDVSVVRVSAGA